MTRDPMNRLTFDTVDRLLPDLDDLRPLRARLLAEAEPEAGRAWSGSGSLQTIGDWRTDAGRLRRLLPTLAADEAEHRTEVWTHVVEALEALQAGRSSDGARAFLEAAALEESRERVDRASAYADAAVRALSGGVDPIVRGRALRRRARARRRLARHGEALADYSAAWDVAEAVGDEQGGAEAAVGAGNVLEDLGRWIEAERWYERALEWLAEREDAVPERLHALFNLHVARRSRGALEASEAPLAEAVRMAEALGDSGAQPFFENARGQLSMARDDVAGAEGHFRNALALAEGARARTTIRLNLAEALLAAGRTLDAAEEARRAEADAISDRVLDRLAEVYRLLGRVAAADGSPDAFVLFERSLSMIDEHGLPTVERARTLQAYAEAETAVGDRDRAAALRTEAEEVYRALGIEHPRSTWVDRHGPDPGRDHLKNENGSDA